MTRIVAIVFALLAVMAFTSSCMDQEPAEVSVRPSLQGQPLDCYVMVYNDKGVQIQEENTDRGFTRITGLKPGTYFMKFKDYSTPPTVYKAVRKVNVHAGDTDVVDVDVSDESKNATDFPGGAAS